MTEQQYLNMENFHIIIDKLDLEFGMYNDKIYIHRYELVEICRLYAIEMCRLQLQECEKNCVLDTAFDDFYISAIKETQLPTELQ